MATQTPTAPQTARTVTQNRSVDEKRRLLKQLLAQKQAVSYAPLSFSQQRLWFLDKMEGPGATYNMKWALALQGTLDLDVLERSLNGVIARHESLRTTFGTDAGEPRQQIAATYQARCTVVDLAAHGAAAETHAASLAHAAACKAFDLARPLLRLVVLRTAPRRHLFVLVMHHIITDGWSMEVFIAETAAFYRALMRDTRPDLEPPGIGYGAYAAQQRQALSGAGLATRMAWWKTYLADAPGLLPLPTKGPRPPVQTNRGEKLQFTFDAALSAGVSELTRRAAVTLFMTLSAGFAALLSRYSGRKDIVIGSPHANRNRRDTRNVIGFFTNTHVLRYDLQDQPDTLTLLKRTRAMLRHAHAHADMPFEKLVQELRPERRTDHHPLFQVIFVLQNTLDIQLDLPGLAVTQRTLDTDTAKFDLNLALTQSTDGLKGYLEYNQDLYARETVTTMLDHYRRLLAQMVAHPDTPLHRLDMLSPATRRQVLETWNRVVPPRPPQNLHTLFAATAARLPEHTALTMPADEDRPKTHWTYAQLRRRADRMARALIRAGVRRGDPVGLCCRRTPEMIAGILGILGAGAAYVPLDGHAPAERLTYILEDAKIAHLVTDAHHRTLFDPDADRRHHDLAGLLHGADTPGDPPLPALDPDDLAYIIYTSGSTGKPKGTLIAHACVARLMSSTDPWYRFGPEDVWVLFHNFAFDVSVWEIWGALLFGGRLVVAPYLTTRSPEATYRLVEEEGVTVLNQTPSAFVQLSTYEAGLSKPGLDALRVVVFAGEALDPGMLEGWWQRRPKDRPRMVNMYGITETTVHVTYQVLGTDPRPLNLVGVPIPDLKLYLLDEAGQPVPVGVPGEIHVAGPGLARGYLGRPALTAARFIPNPFDDAPYGRLYRSGDLARHEPDGTLVYLGRIDHQVKIRGFRVELGEIEQTLNAVPEVACSVVQLVKDHLGYQRLVAYLCFEDRGTEPDRIAALKQRIKTTLPDYMVPSAFNVLPAMPLTQNGKVDRRRLPPPDFSVGLPTVSAPPRNDLESRIAALWRDLLAVDQVGIHDNFFDIGGHSLLLVKLHERLSSETDRRFTVVDLFKHTTVAEQAAFLAAEKEAPSFAVNEARGKRKKEALRHRRARHGARGAE